MGKIEATFYQDTLELAPLEDDLVFVEEADHGQKE